MDIGLSVPKFERVHSSKRFPGSLYHGRPPLDMGLGPAGRIRARASVKPESCFYMLDSRSSLVFLTWKSESTLEVGFRAGPPPGLLLWSTASAISLLLHPDHLDVVLFCRPVSPGSLRLLGCAHRGFTLRHGPAHQSRRLGVEPRGFGVIIRSIFRRGQRQIIALTRFITIPFFPVSHRQEEPIEGASSGDIDRPLERVDGGFPVVDSECRDTPSAPEGRVVRIRV